MRLKNIGSGSFGSYDFGGARLEAQPGEEFECSDRIGEILLAEQPHRFELVGAAAASGAEQPEMAPGDAAPEPAPAPLMDSGKRKRRR